MDEPPIAPPVKAITTKTPCPPPSIDLLQALLEGTPDAVYFKDRESRFTHISRGLARQLGLADPQEAYGKTDRDFFATEHADQAMADERHILDTGDPIIDLVEKETWPDGHVTWASTTKLPLRNAAGEIVGTFGISRDITARKAAEQRLQAAQHDLVEAAQRAAVTQFAADVLTKALGLLDTAQHKTERIRRRAARTSADALGQLASQLTSRLGTGSAAHQLAVDLCALTTTAAAEQKALLEDIDDLRLNLRELTRLLEAPK